MKKALFLLLLVPFIAVSQSTLATWNNINTTSNTVASNQYLSTTAIVAQGVSSTPGQWNGFQTSNWPTTGSFDATKYVYFSISSLPNNTVTVSSIAFAYSGTAKKQKLQYILNGTALAALENTTTDSQAEDWASHNYSQALNITIPAGQTLVIRISAAQGSTRQIGNITVNGSSTMPAAYTGTYHIGAAQPFPFNTITNAVNAINTYGVSGNVIYLLDDALYSTNETFPIVLGKIGGNSNNTSSSKTLTIKPAPGVNTVIEANNGFANNNIVYVPAAFILKSADYVTFDGSNTTDGTTKNLTIVNKNTEYNSGRRAVIWVADNANDPATNNTVKNTILKNGSDNSGSALTAGVYSGNYSLQGTQTAHINYVAAAVNNSNLTVTNNTFSNVKQGVVVNGGTGAATATNIVVTRNDMGAYATSNTVRLISGVYLNNVNTFNVADNNIHDIYRDNTNEDSTTDTYTYSSGIFVAGASKNGTIARNKVIGILRATPQNSYLLAGINLASSESSTSVLVANNFVTGIQTNGGGDSGQDAQGIAITNGGDYKIYFNTVNMTGSQSTGGYSSAFYVGPNAGTGLDVRNNIFANNQTGTSTRRTAVRIVKASTSGFTYLDYNDLYAPVVGFLGTSPNTGDNAGYQASKSGWQSVTGKEANAVNVNPAFASATDLHLIANNATNATLVGITIGSVKKDIDGQVRNIVTPTIGASEYGVSPYVDATTCDVSTVWNGTAWSNGEPTATTNAIFNASYTQNGGVLNACTLFVMDGATVIFTNNSTAKVVHSVNVTTAGSLTFESSSNLIQVENDANTGIVTVKRLSGKLRRLDYTIWSTPVVDSRATGFQTLKTFSPETLASRFYTYTTTQGVFTPVDENTTRFAAADGYLIRMPNANSAAGYNAGTARIQYNGVFTGTPNNGVVTKSIGYGDRAHAFTMVGNPYASPMSIKAFINANIDQIEGTVWLWRKTNNATQTSYCTANLTGYVANRAPGGSNTDGNDLIVNPYSVDPSGFLNTAQGFFVKALGANKQVAFNNTMRIDTHSNAFFRAAAPTTDISRVWLNVTNAAGEFDQVLLAYNPATTTGYDNGYDGRSMSSGNLSLYSTLNVENETINLAIQTRGAFNAADVVPMGFAAPTAGTYTVSVDQADGVFAQGQVVYLTDNVEGITRNITEKSYTFTTEAGTFANRFTVTYAQGALGTDNPIATPAKDVIVYKDNKQVAVTAPQVIKSVVVYDMLGRSLYNNAKVNSNEFKTNDINTAQQVVVVLVTLDNNQVVSKKIMMN